MTAVELVAVLLLPVAVFVVVWPLVELRSRRRPRRPAQPGQTSYRPGIAHVSWDATLVDAYAGRSW